MFTILFPTCMLLMPFPHASPLISSFRQFQPRRWGCRGLRWRNSRVRSVRRISKNKIRLPCLRKLPLKVEGSSIEEAVASAIAMGATKDQVCPHRMVKVSFQRLREYVAYRLQLPWGGERTQPWKIILPLSIET